MRSVGTAHASRAGWDVVIVGGGPAGSALGRLLGGAGISAVIAERARFPRDKPCGGMLSPKSVPLVDSIFGRDVLAALARSWSDGCRFFHRGDLVGEVAGCERSCFVERCEMDALLLAGAAEAGCEVIEGDAVVAVDARGGSVRLRSGRALRGAVLAGADGALSIVRRCLHGRGWAHHTGFGLVANVPVADLRSAGAGGVPEIHFGVLPWGYGWVFPKGEVANVGVGGMVTKVRNFREPFNALVRAVCRPDAGRALSVRGWRLPSGDFERRPGRRNVLLLGDAAGMAEPLTGEGIAFALRSAQAAATAVAGALRSGRPERAGRLYTATCGRDILPALAEARWARFLFFPEAAQRRAVRKLRRRPDLLRAYLDVLAGRMSYRAYLLRALR